MLPLAIHQEALDERLLAMCTADQAGDQGVLVGLPNLYRIAIPYDIYCTYTMLTSSIYAIHRLDLDHAMHLWLSLSSYSLSSQKMSLRPSRSAPRRRLRPAPCSACTSAPRGAASRSSAPAPDPKSDRRT